MYQTKKEYLSSKYVDERIDDMQIERDRRDKRDKTEPIDFRNYKNYSREYMTKGEAKIWLAFRDKMNEDSKYLKALKEK